MIDRRLFDELGTRLNEVLRSSPAQDLEKNVRALLAVFFDRFDLVAREDFEVQRKLLERATHSQNNRVLAFMPFGKLSACPTTSSPRA